MTGTLDRLATALADRYRVGRELGAGGMATVYLAHDLRHGRDVAIKVLHAELSETLGRERFEREIRLAARLTHPHILPLFDSGEAEGVLFYVMPVMRGETLRTRLAAGALPVVEAVRIATAVADALDYAHRHDIVHRDIKPENILLHEGHAVVADFGIGKALAAASAPTAGEPRAAFTQVGLAVGTPAYMSPEQAAGDLVDGRSDLFALGCVLFEMLTGSAPFAGATAQAVIARRFTHVPPPVTQQRPGVPEAVSRTVERLLERAVDDRLASGAQVVRALAGELALVARRAMPSVAVLPFANMSADPENAYFSDGITDDIIGALTRVPGLKVAARASAFTFRDPEVDLGRVGTQLGVAHVLQGSVRRAGSRVRVTAQLMAARDGTQQWSGRWDRELADIFAIQDEIAQAIVSALEVQLGAGAAAGPLVPAPTQDLDAYELFLRGRETIRRRTPSAIRTGVEQLQGAVARDPALAAAWLALAEAQAVLGNFVYDNIPKCRALALEALAAAVQAGARPEEIAMHRLFVALYAGGDWVSLGAVPEAILRQAPRNVFANVMASHYFAITGNAAALAVTVARSVEADPLSAWAHVQAGYACLTAGSVPEAQGWFERGIALDVGSVNGPIGLTLCHLRQGRVREAVGCARRGHELGEHSAMTMALLSYALYVAGEADEARPLAEAARQAERAAVGSAATASLMIALASGDDDEVAAALHDTIACGIGPVGVASTIGYRLRQRLDHPRLGPLVRRLPMFDHLRATASSPA